MAEAMDGRFLFFSGKGGVGKTSMAAITAVRCAERGKRTLIVTTDPASNLADVFEQPIGHRITAIEGVPNLWAMEIDPDRATQEYIDHAMAPIRAAFPQQMVQVMEEQMSGPCTAEVAAFDRFTDFLELPDDGQVFDLVIFDTAPTGHTIRLLELPAEWTQTIDTADEGSGQTCIGPSAAIQDAKDKYERALRTLRDPTHTTFVFVLHPEAIAIRETRRAIDELEKLGIHTHRLIVNGIIPPDAAADSLFAARAEMQARYLESDRSRAAVSVRTHVAARGRDQGRAPPARGGAGVLRRAGSGRDRARPRATERPARRPPAFRTCGRGSSPTAAAGRSSSPARAASARPSRRASRRCGWLAEAIKRCC